LQAALPVLELGIGVGLFARFFLDEFQNLCLKNGEDYYDRLCYVAGDYSDRMLRDGSKNGVFANHPGRFYLRVVNALDPVADLQRDFQFCESPRPFQAVFLNYLLDCLPATVLRFSDSDIAQLFVRTCLARGVDLAQHTKMSAEELSEIARSTDPKVKRELQEVYSLFASEYDYQPAEPGSVPFDNIAQQFALFSNSSYVWHSYGAMQSLERLLTLICDDGFILLNEYGHTDPSVAQDFEHQRFSQSTSIGLNFPELKWFFTEFMKCRWEEPEEDTGSIYARLLGHRLGQKTVSRFRERFKKDTYEDTQEPAQVARSCLQAGCFEAAGTAYRKALEKQPLNWMLMSEIAKFLTFTLRTPDAGASMARAALKLNPNCSAELWNTYGDSLFVLEKFEEARHSFQRALRINPKDARAYYNLSFAYLQQKDYAAALDAIAKGLLFDEAGEFREGFLQKQTEILAYLANRYKQECQLQANRLNKYPNPARRKKIEGTSAPLANPSSVRPTPVNGPATVKPDITLQSTSPRNHNDS
jgi:tetratricopeptide (TPR) repeat protein